MAFSDLKTAVESLSTSQIGDTVAGQAVNRAYQTICRLRPWMQLWKTTTFASAVDKSGGTVTLTAGSASVTGTGTAWAASDAGRYLVVGAREPIRVSTVTDATHLTLTTAWGEASLANQSYQLVSVRYQAPSDCERILRIRGPLWTLTRISMRLLDVIDPRRAFRGAPPVAYAEAEVVNGVLEFELWQLPNSADTYFFEYRPTVPALVNATDVPLVRPEAVQWLAMADTCRILYSRSGEATWMTLGREYDGLYAQVLQAMTAEDRRLRGPHPVVLDSDDVLPGTSTASTIFYRTLHALGLTNVS